MKRSALLLITLFFIVLFTFENVAAGETDPYTIYGTVKDGDGNAISGATITVTNKNTNEKNYVGNDTITGNPIPIATDVDGKYTFELTNLKSSYSYGDEILVTAKIEDRINSDSVTLKEGNWGSRMDITIGIKNNNDDGSLFWGIFWTLFVLMFIVALVMIIILYRKQKPKKKQPTQMSVEEELPPPPPWLKQRKDIVPLKKENEPPPMDDEIPPPDDEVGYSLPDGEKGLTNIVSSGCWLLFYATIFRFLMTFPFFGTEISRL